MDRFFDSLISIFIAIIVFGIFAIGIRIGIAYKTTENEVYNYQIIDFTTDFLLGRRNYSDIDELDCPDEIKDTLKKWYTDTFYTDDDLILVSENIDIYDSIKGDIKRLYDSCESEEEYRNAVFDRYEEEAMVSYSSGYEGSEEEEQRILNSRRYKEYVYYNNFKNSQTKNNFEYVKKDNNLYVYANDVLFDEYGICNCFYDGISFNLYEDIVDKRVWKQYNTENMEYSNEVKEKEVDKNQNRFLLENNKAFRAVYKMGKVVEIKINS